MPTDLEPTLIGDKTTGRALAAVLFMGAAQMAMDVFSALSSSPWTSENFGADPDKAKSAREYVWQAIVFSSAYGVAGGIIAESWWPIIGVVIINLYMWWIYDRALKRGAKSGSVQWSGGDPAAA
jgi:hypothetical protein